MTTVRLVKHEQETKAINKGYDTLPWIEKYRPSSLNEIISHDEIIATLRIFIKKRCLPHLLFYGPPGTGKTSTIMACAKELYGEYYTFMVMELNASDDRGIEVVRNKIKQFVTSQNVFFGENPAERQNMFKLVILDETDAMTADAQAILRKVVEKYTVNTRFCLICNYIQNINPALQSRCTKFRFAPLDKENITNKVNDVIAKENIKVTKTGLDVIIRRSYGDMRKVLNNLQSTSMSHDIVNEENVNLCLGYPSRAQMKTITSSLINDNFEQCYTKISEIKQMYGLSVNDIIRELHDVLLNDILITENEVNPDVRKLSVNKVTDILDKLRLVELNQAVCTIDNIQIAAIVGIFKY